MDEMIFNIESKFWRTAYIIAKLIIIPLVIVMTFYFLTEGVRNDTETIKRIEKETVATAVALELIRYTDSVNLAYQNRSDLRAEENKRSILRMERSLQGITAEVLQAKENTKKLQEKADKTFNNIDNLIRKSNEKIYNDNDAIDIRSKRISDRYN